MKEKGPLAPVVGTPRSIRSPESESAKLQCLKDSPEYFQAMLDFCFERTYLAAAGEFEPQPLLASDRVLLAWRRVTRLPVHPTRGADESLLQRWQRMLATLHTLDRRLVFVLLRHGGQTSLYLGTASLNGLVDSASAVAQLEQAAKGEMPGLSLEPLSGHSDDEVNEFRKQLARPLNDLPRCGAITGLPSLRRSLLEAGGFLSSGAEGTLELLAGIDPVAQGFPGINGSCNYSLIVVADSVPDPQISDLIRRFRMIGGRVHEAVRMSKQVGRSEEEIRKQPSNATFWFTLFGSMIPYVGAAPAAAIFGSMAPFVVANIGDKAESYFKGLTTGVAKAASSYFNGLPARAEGSNISTTKERLDMVAEYCEVLIKRHIERLNRGRSLGFWKTGVYVLGETDDAVQTVCGMLRAAYSGDESHVEPIRAVSFQAGVRAHEYVRNFCHVPMPAPLHQSSNNDPMPAEWHLLGPLYQYVSTPLNTEELSVTAGLPRRDVPGLRAERNQVRFSLNGPTLPEKAKPVTLGDIMGPGGVPCAEYKFDVNGRVWHGLLVGATGSGKSTTCRRLVGEAALQGVPYLILEPTKNDYARWAVEHNRTCSDARRIALYMPGAPDFDGIPVEPLHLNPFQPAFVEGDRPDPLAHLERVVAALNTSMPMVEVLPILLEAAVLRLAEHDAFGLEFEDVPPFDSYPSLGKLMEHVEFLLYKEVVIPGQSGRYAGQIQTNLHTALDSRIKHLIRGRRGVVLDVNASTKWDDLFERPAVVNLSQFGNEADKALVISLLLIALFEWRVSKFTADREYRDKAREKRLMHLAVVEEAHTILRRHEPTHPGVDNPQAVAARMINDMLAGARQYGQGLLVIDQDPSLLVPDVIKNTNFRIVHQLPHEEDRAALASCMLLRSDQRDFLGVLPVGHAVISTEYDDAPCWVSIIEIPPEVT
jgi:DNA helicase HerA-like ATPase